MGAALDSRQQAAAGLSRRAFVGGLLGGGALGLAPGAALAVASGDDAGLLFSLERRALALSHQGERVGLVQIDGPRSAAVVHTGRRQFTLALGAGQRLREVQAAWMSGPAELMLLDGRSGLLQGYSIEGEPLAATALPARALLAAGGCADGAGGCYVSLPGEHRIVRIPAGGGTQHSFGALGAEPGALNYPTALARLDDGSLLVANSGNRRIDRFAADGAFAGTVARFGFMPRQMALSGGALAVYDPYAAKVMVLSLHTGLQAAALALPKMRAGLGRCQSLTAAGARRFLVSV
jgi:hypothetical protein